ncbi:MAG: hypothetical protein V4520_20905 [Bacteroidota bacterium]
MNEKFKGMTVNEMLYVSGLFDAFFKAVDDKDVATATLILKKIELDDSLIPPILKQRGLI